MLVNVIVMVSVILGLAGILIASEGAVRTQAILLSVGQRDIIIDAMAWIDRKTFAVYRARRKRK